MRKFLTKGGGKEPDVLVSRKKVWLVNGKPIYVAPRTTSVVLHVSLHLHKHLKLHARKVQIVQPIKPDDRPRRTDFASGILKLIDEDNGVHAWILLSDEAIFHVSGKVKRLKARIWGSKIPHSVV
jgi:hypothetical protein